MARINDFGMPFTSVAGDRSYSSTDWREYFRMLAESGVVGDIGNELQVKPQAAPNKTVFVETGAILINGVVRILESTTNLSLTDNTSGSTRIDRVVARLNATDRKIELAVLQGTPGGSAPDLTRTATVHEMSLAQVTLANGYSTIGAGQITDERLDDAVCGYSKTIYMSKFDDENNLLKYNRVVTASDAAGNPTTVEYRRTDATVFLRRVYSNPDANGYYRTVVETFRKANGTTIYKTHTYALTFSATGLILTSSRVVS